MKIGIWNIDHPETQSRSKRKELRFSGVARYLAAADCDLLIITEANAALRLPGYYSQFSAPSPFIAKSRFYENPNVYHQVGIYSKLPIQAKNIAEPINGLLCEIKGGGKLKQVYGNVITIKDQWSKTSTKTYTDRLDEQIQAIRNLPPHGTLVGGDFNLRLGWKQKRPAHRRFQEELNDSNWAWPTEQRDDSVQHVLHTKEFTAKLSIDFDVKYQKGNNSGLSDHPFFGLELD